LTHARLREDDPAGALAVAERAARLAPGDPNGWFLAGEIAAASGQWARADRWFQGAVVRAPFSQLRFHAGAVEAAARAGDVSGARHRYAEALAAFSPDRVVHPEARCLAPGDRYLLARMGRIAAGLHRTAGDHA
jgi:tetratricopeptide (TPR) repeat protein